MKVSDTSAYKKGIVFGLTLAEILILFLFCILMALTFILNKQNILLSEKDSIIAIQDNRIQEYAEIVPIDHDPATTRLIAVLKEYWERYKPRNVEDRTFFFMSWFYKFKS